MVDGSKISPEVMAAAMALKSGEVSEFDALAELMPTYARVEVPLSNQCGLRYSADILRQLAMSLDLLSRQSGISQRSARFQAWSEIKAANVRMAKSVEVK
jgi:hypothetical protein